MKTENNEHRYRSRGRKRGKKLYVKVSRGGIRL